MLRNSLRSNSPHCENRTVSRFTLDNTMEEQKILDEQVEKLKQEAEENLAGWKRAMADYQNFKKETERERAIAIKYGSQTAILSLLPCLDHFREAVAHIPKEDESKGWVVGILLIKKEMEDAFKQFGLEELECVGELFDPTKHEAVGEDLPSDLSSETLVKDEALAKEGNGIKSGIVIKEVQKGYKLNGEILRPSKVIISK